MCTILQFDSLRQKCSYSEFFWSLFFDTVSVRIQSEYGKIRTRKIPNTDTFYTVICVDVGMYKVKRSIYRRITNEVFKLREDPYCNLRNPSKILKILPYFAPHSESSSGYPGFSSASQYQPLCFHNLNDSAANFCNVIQNEEPQWQHWHFVKNLFGLKSFT